MDDVILSLRTTDIMERVGETYFDLGFWQESPRQASKEQPTCPVGSQSQEKEKAEAAHEKPQSLTVGDEMEEVFRFLVHLIPDNEEWKLFAKDGLKLNRSAYDLTVIDANRKVEMLKKWKAENGANATPEKLAQIIRLHFENQSSLGNVLKTGLGGLRDGLERVCQTLDKMSVNYTVDIDNVYGHDVRFVDRAYTVQGN